MIKGNLLEFHMIQFLWLIFGFAITASQAVFAVPATDSEHYFFMSNQEAEQACAASI